MTEILMVPKYTRVLACQVNSLASGFVGDSKGWYTH